MASSTLSHKQQSGQKSTFSHRQKVARTARAGRMWAWQSLPANHLVTNKRRLSPLRAIRSLPARETASENLLLTSFAKRMTRAGPLLRGALLLLSFFWLQLLQTNAFVVRPARALPHVQRLESLGPRLVWRTNSKSSLPPSVNVPPVARGATTAGDAGADNPEASGPVSAPPPLRGISVKAVVVLLLGELLVGALALPLGSFFKINPLSTLLPLAPAALPDLLLKGGGLSLPLLVFHFFSGSAINDMLQEGLKEVFGDKPGVGTLLLLSVLLSISAGVGEEVFFRGALQPILSSKFGTTAGIGVSSVLFGALHASTPRYFILATLLSIYLGVVHQRLSCLLIPIIIHTVFDVVGFLYHVLLASWTMWWRRRWARLRS